MGRGFMIRLLAFAFAPAQTNHKCAPFHSKIPNLIQIAPLIPPSACFDQEGKSISIINYIYHEVLI